VGERFADVNALDSPMVAVGVMVWVAISYGQQTQLHFIDVNLNVQKYSDKFLMPIVRPILFLRDL
jgi:hypothetical protein